jgi:hypothetical protein
MKYPITNQVQLRAEFWEQFPPEFRKKVNGRYNVDARMAFVDFLDHLRRDGQISEALAFRATLER